MLKKLTQNMGLHLPFTHLEAGELGHWAETFQVAKGNDGKPQLPQPQNIPKVPQYIV